MSVKVTKVDFLKSISDFEVYLSSSESYDCEEICVVGRSNVGKSSFINMLAGRDIAKTSSTPGRTRLINLFPFTLESSNSTLDIMLVDLPGYGYAEAAKKDKKEWGELIENYLAQSVKLKHIFVLLDSRHPPTAQDKQMVKFLYYYGMQFTVVATKTDKLSKAELERNIMTIAKEIMIGRDNILAVSAEKNINKDKALARLYAVMSVRNENPD